MTFDRISKNNRTIIFSIHQPRFAIYKLFEHLVLLAKGNIVYQGPCSEALDYFADLGECAFVVICPVPLLPQLVRVHHAKASEFRVLSDRDVCYAASISK